MEIENLRVAPPLPIKKGQVYSTNVNSIIIERGVRKKKGSWFQLSENLK
jgi:hypothetical protein